MSDRLVLEPRLRTDQAREEATRCLQCFDAPCVQSCPAGIVIPRFIRMIRSGNVAGAAEVVRASNPMASGCGVACPDEQLCGAACLRAAIDRPIEIRRLHRFATETGEGKGLRPAPAVEPPAPARRRAGAAAGRRKRVAVIGAGPAGLAGAFELRRAGLAVTVFEARDRVGGVMARTIPLYRFPEECVRRDAGWALGAKGEVELRLRSRVLQPEALRREYDALLLAVGLVDRAPRWEGTDLRGVMSADAFLTRARASRYRHRIGREIAIIGGGNVAIDAALAAVRCGQVQGETPQVHLLYRRTRREMPAWEREVSRAEQEGVLLHFLVVPERFTGVGRRLTGIALRRTRLVTQEGETRPSPVPVPGSGFHFPCEQAVLAVGQGVDPALLRLLPRTRNGYLRARGRTREMSPGIYAGGDAAGGEQTIVSAVRDGRRAARSILAFLEGRGR